MPIDFPSEEWTTAYQEALNASESYKEAGKNWTHGPIALVVKAEPAIGVEQDTAFILDLHQGVCRKAWISDLEEANKQPFVITGSYAQWKMVMRKELDPIKGMMQGKLKLKGNLPYVVRYLKGVQESIRCLTELDSRFPDD